MTKYLDLEGSKYLITKIKELITSAAVKTAETLSSTLPIEKGGTGKVTAEEAWTALGGGDIGKLNTNKSPEAANKFLKADGTFAEVEVAGDASNLIIVSELEPENKDCMLWIEP